MISRKYANFLEIRIASIPSHKHANIKMFLESASRQANESGAEDITLLYGSKRKE